MYENEVLPAGGVITGLGVIENRTCVVVASDPNVKAGSYYPISTKKHVRAQEIALKNKLPCVYLMDSSGINLPK